MSQNNGLLLLLNAFKLCILSYGQVEFALPIRSTPNVHRITEPWLVKLQLGLIPQGCEVITPAHSNPTFAFSGTTATLICWTFHQYPNNRLARSWIELQCLSKGHTNRVPQWQDSSQPSMNRKYYPLQRAVTHQSTNQAQHCWTSMITCRVH